MSAGRIISGQSRPASACSYLAHSDASFGPRFASDRGPVGISTGVAMPDRVAIAERWPQVSAPDSVSDQGWVKSLAQSEPRNRRNPGLALYKTTMVSRAGDF